VCSVAAALGEGDGHTYSLTGCTWTGQGADGWELFSVDASAELPESARLAILGGRRELLFIEGEAHSLDLRLYKLLFPNWTLFPAGGCDQVIRAVTGLRTSRPHHWLNARGVVDGDGRTADEEGALQARGILALPVSEVENLYYSDVVMKAVAATQAALVDESADTLLNQARMTALQALGEGPDVSPPGWHCRCLAAEFLKSCRPLSTDRPRRSPSTSHRRTRRSCRESRRSSIRVILTALPGSSRSAIPRCAIGLRAPFGSKIPLTTRPPRACKFVPMRLWPLTYARSSDRCPHEPPVDQAMTARRPVTSRGSSTRSMPRSVPSRR